MKILSWIQVSINFIVFSLKMKKKKNHKADALDKTSNDHITVI